MDMVLWSHQWPICITHVPKSYHRGRLRLGGNSTSPRSILSSCYLLSLIHMWELDIILTSILELCPRHSTLLLAGRATCTCEDVGNKINTQQLSLQRLSWIAYTAETWMALYTRGRSNLSFSFNDQFKKEHRFVQNTGYSTYMFSQGVYFSS